MTFLCIWCSKVFSDTELRLIDTKLDENVCKVCFYKYGPEKFTTEQLCDELIKRGHGKTLKNATMLEIMEAACDKDPNSPISIAVKDTLVTVRDFNKGDAPFKEVMYNLKTASKIHNENVSKLFEEED